MENELVRYFIGDLYAGETGIGFLVCDRSGNSGDPTIAEVTERAIVATAGIGPEVMITSASLLEISEEEFALYHDTEMSIPGLPGGLAIWQIKEVTPRSERRLAPQSSL